MDHSALQHAVARLTAEQLQHLCANKSGKHWQVLLAAFHDSDVDGDTLREFLRSPDDLHSFLQNDLDLDIPKVLARQLLKLLAKSVGGGASPSQRPPLHAQQAVEEKDGQHDGVDKALQSRVSVRVKFTPSRGRSPKRVTVDTTSRAPPRTAVRSLLDHLQLPLSTTIILSHAGMRLDGDQDVDWAALSVVHAVQLSDDTLLSLDNLLTHPVTAVTVHTSDSQLPRHEALGEAAVAQGWCLHIEDDESCRQLLGRGAFGEVYRGKAVFGRRSVMVAVKKFFMVKDPQLYGLHDDAALAQWAERELLPEINTLLGLSHPNLVRLRCVAPFEVYGRQFPAYVAMDYCGEGTLEQWIAQRRLTDGLLPAFLQDLVSAMVYLHVEKRVIHRDLKPANIFARRDAGRDGRPTLVVGDVGLAKEIQHTMARASAAGTPMYLAPEVTGVAPRCSMASDVFSASLVAVEMITGVCVYTHVYTSKGDRAELVSQATEKLKHILSFAEDSPLTIEAMSLLVTACTKEHPTDRCSFREVQRLCQLGDAPAVATHSRAEAGTHPRAALRAQEAGVRAAPQAREAEVHPAGHAKEEEIRTASLEKLSQWSGGRITVWSVRELSLAGLRLGGRIPTELGLLTNMQSMMLAENKLTGPIPTQIGQLVQLTRLDLHKNQLTGRIPTELGLLTNMQRMSLALNKLTGCIPTQIGHLVQLTHLDLHFNKLAGAIPTQIGHLIQLTHLDLHFNKLAGRIPTQIGRLVQLTTLALHKNQLTGSIPTQIGQLVQLEILWLHQNQLTGRIPTELGLLTNMKSIGLSLNKMTGRIRTEFGRLTAMQQLSLSSNKFTGPMPTQIGQLVQLEKLWLDRNQLTGPIPTQIGQLVQLTGLQLYSNQLTGPIPTDIGQLVQLIHLDVENNQLTGRIPTELGLLTNMHSMSLAANELTGRIPTELGLLTNMKTMRLAVNKLTGHIPTELGCLTAMRYCCFEQNKLTGPIPTQIGEVVQLKELYLRYNQLTGRIPTELGLLTNMQSMILAENKLTGCIPTEIGLLVQLRYLQLWRNQLTGRIPTELGLLANTKTMILVLNKLTGRIPTELGLLTNMKTMGLALNKLTDTTGFKQFMKQQVPRASVRI